MTTLPPHLEAFAVAFAATGNRRTAVLAASQVAAGWSARKVSEQGRRWLCRTAVRQRVAGLGVDPDDVGHDRSPTPSSAMALCALAEAACAAPLNGMGTDALRALEAALARARARVAGELAARSLAQTEAARPPAISAHTSATARTAP